MISSFEEVLERFEDIIYSRSVDHTDYSDSQLVEGEITFISGWRLEFMEFRSLDKHKYRFHLMNGNNELVERGDTAPHYKELDNSTFHKHTGDGVKSTEELEGTEILTKLCEKVLENL
jgi:hypothetical protein